MAENKKPAPKGASTLNAACLWAAAQWAVDWFLVQDGGLLQAGGAAFGGFVAGWVTTGLINTLARWKVPAGALGVLGLILGVAVVSGAVNGLSSLFNWFSTKSLDFDLEKLQGFVISWNVVPAAVLGLLTGLWVGRKSASGKKK